MRDATGRARAVQTKIEFYFSLFFDKELYREKGRERERWSLNRVGGEGEMNRQSSLSLMDVTDLTTFPAAIQIIESFPHLLFLSPPPPNPTQLVLLASISRLDYISLLVHLGSSYKVRSGESIFDWNL